MASEQLPKKKNFFLAIQHSNFMSVKSNISKTRPCVLVYFKIIYFCYISLKVLDHNGLKIRSEPTAKRPFHTKSLRSTAPASGSTHVVVKAQVPSIVGFGGHAASLATCNLAGKGLGLTESQFLEVVANGRISSFVPGFVRAPEHTKTGTSPSSRNRAV